MSETKFTPGAWPAPRYDNDTGPFDDYFIEWWEIDGVCKVYKKEDAHLIAAAPELYEALKELLLCMNVGESLLPVKKANDALAKARGEI